MPNTYVNFGGHKVTTNKVGQVHIATLLSDFSTDTGTVAWCVQNGMCYLSFSRILPVNTGLKNLVTNLPKSKLFGYALCSNTEAITVGTVMIGAGQNTVQFNSASATRFWGTLVYPVADDWIES